MIPKRGVVGRNGKNDQENGLSAGALQPSIVSCSCYTRTPATLILGKAKAVLVCFS
ncbi:hypothetical protein ASZ90_014894 [hydrocarbon metagenome]|uniref:Uncharacterized protein n=1 Tax=hydrocarbon metagenome TaxID=938273 RepID=A0A0W8F3F2_9ZZZZ